MIMKYFATRNERLYVYEIRKADRTVYHSTLGMYPWPYYGQMDTHMHRQVNGPTNRCNNITMHLSSLSIIVGEWI